jgi:polyisoprenyl-teichoic acid--peptidoglycan teichoic acid transferase
VDLPKLPRRPLLTGLLAAPMVVAGCSSTKPPKPAATTTTTTPTTTTAPPKPAATGAGLPADLLVVATALYVGGKVPSAGAVAAALGKRKPLGRSVTVGGSAGTWKGTRIAVLTQGKDVTLLTKDKAGWTVVGGWWPSLSVGRPAFPTMRVLAIGSDARSGQPVEKCRGDALHIIGVDAKGVGGIVGIPRDSWVTMSNGGTSKINAALVLGGAKGQASTVARVAGVPIDGYVITGFKGFRGMVSALGGITFVAKSSLKSVDGYQIVKPGTNHLNSKTALGLARERKHLANGDFGRSANQGLIIKAGMVMARKAGPGALPRLLTKMSPHLSSNLSPAQVLNLCASLYLGDPAAVRNTVVPGAVGTRSGQSVVLLGGTAHSIFRDIRDGRLNA